MILQANYSLFAGAACRYILKSQRCKTKTAKCSSRHVLVVRDDVDVATMPTLIISIKCAVRTYVRKGKGVRTLVTMELYVNPIDKLEKMPSNAGRIVIVKKQQCQHTNCCQFVPGMLVFNQLGVWSMAESQYDFSTTTLRTRYFGIDICVYRFSADNELHADFHTQGQKI